MPLCPPGAAVRAALQKVLSSAGRTTHTHTPVDAIRMEISRPSQGQQDVAEFLHHIGPRLIPEHLVGIWQARLRHIKTYPA